MKNFFLLGMSAIIVAAQDEPGVSISIPLVTVENTEFKGDIDETKHTEGATESVSLEFVWKTNNDDRDGKFEDGYWIQNYAQWPDVRAEGTYMAVSCNAEWNDSQSYAENVIIHNFAESSSISVGDLPSQAWGVPESATESSVAIFGMADSDLEALYTTRYSRNREYMQRCTAIGTLWSVTDGEPDDEVVNNLYHDLKESGTLSIQSGFRVYESQNANAPVVQGDSTIVELQLTDFPGTERPEEEPELPDCEADPCAEGCEGGENCGVTTDDDGIPRLYFIIGGVGLLIIIVIIVLIIMCCVKKSMNKATPDKFGSEYDTNRGMVSKRS